MAEPNFTRVSDPASSDDEVRDEIRGDSDALLGAVAELRTLETAKRDVQMSTPEFHAKASRIEDIARRVLGLATRERVHGDELAGPQEESIADEAEDRDEPANVERV